MERSQVFTTLSPPPPPTLEVDVEQGEVALEGRVLRNQWLDLYALLAIAATEPGADRTVTADRLSRSGPWRDKTPASVGKEVARHLTALERDNCEVVAAVGKTKAWKLSVSSTDIHFVPDRQAVLRWLTQREARAVTEVEFDLLVRLIKHSIAIHSGHALDALNLDDFDGATDPTAANGELRAWAALIKGREAYQCEEWEMLDRLVEKWNGQTGSAAHAVVARLRGLLSLRDRFTVPQLALNRLTRIISHLETSGDVASLGAINNIIGIMLRRLGDPGTAALHHLRASALLGVAGDYASLQGAIFNLALCRRAMGDRSSAPDARTMQLIDLCRDLCSQFGVGSDSAQAEIVGAKWALKRGECGRASRYLAAAEELLRQLPCSYDQACFLVARAEYALSDAKGITSPPKAIRDLRAALRLLEDIHEEPLIKHVKELLAHRC